MPDCNINLLKLLVNLIPENSLITFIVQKNNSMRSSKDYNIVYNASTYIYIVIHSLII